MRDVEIDDLLNEIRWLRELKAKNDNVVVFALIIGFMLGVSVFALVF